MATAENRGESRREIGMLGGDTFKAILKLHDKMHQNTVLTHDWISEHDRMGVRI